MCPGKHTEFNKHKGAGFPASGSGPKIDNLETMVWGTSAAPADGTAGYDVGCIWINRSGSTLATIVLANIGSGTSCQFVGMNTLE